MFYLVLHHKFLVGSIGVENVVFVAHWHDAEREELSNSLAHVCPVFFNL